MDSRVKLDVLCRIHVCEVQLRGQVCSQVQLGNEGEIRLRKPEASQLVSRWLSEATPPVFIMERLHPARGGSSLRSPSNFLRAAIPPG